MIRRQVALIPLIDCRVGCLEMRGKKAGIEQREREPVGRQLVTDLAETPWIGREVDREVLVLPLSRGDRLSYPAQRKMHALQTWIDREFRIVRRLESRRRGCDSRRKSIRSLSFRASSASESAAVPYFEDARFAPRSPRPSFATVGSPKTVACKTGSRRLMSMNALNDLGGIGVPAPPLAIEPSLRLTCRCAPQ